MHWIGTWKHFEQAVSFGQVGRPLSTNVVPVTSWEDALGCATSESYEQLKLDAANAYRVELNEVAPPQIARWNAVTKAIRDTAFPVVRARVAALGLDRHLEDKLRIVVEWDVVHLLAQAEFFQYVPNGFYIGLGYWYTAGHFPCGWQGAHPQGKLIVF